MVDEYCKCGTPLSDNEGICERCGKEVSASRKAMTGKNLASDEAIVVEKERPYIKTGQLFFWLFLSSAIVGLLFGIIQERAEYSNSWKKEGFETLSTNSAFQFKRETDSFCESANGQINGCWIYAIVAKDDCLEVTGLHSQMRESDSKDLGNLTAISQYVTRGEPFTIEFGATQDPSAESIVGDLFSLECTRSYE
jgi:hypothetical protein